MLAFWLDLVAAFLLAYNVRNYAVALGLLAGFLIDGLVLVGWGNAFLFSPMASIAAEGGLDHLIAHAYGCALTAWIFRGFLNGSIQAWWRLL